MRNERKRRRREERYSISTGKGGYDEEKQICYGPGMRHKSEHKGKWLEMRGRK